MQRYREKMYRDSLITSVRHGREDFEVRTIHNGGRGGDRKEKAGRCGDVHSGKDERGDERTHEDRESRGWYDLEADGGAQAGD